VLRLGLLAARKMIDPLGGGCELAVSWVYPLNPDAKVPAAWMPLYADEASTIGARRKLRHHFFRKVGTTRFDGLSLSQVTPNLADIIRPGG
jgi:hypothetical protein